MKAATKILALMAVKVIKAGSNSRKRSKGVGVLIEDTANVSNKRKRIRLMICMTRRKVIISRWP
jgi:Tfp pilus assembly protein PilZ